MFGPPPVTVIRPHVPPAQPQPQRLDEGRLAAQRAFFEQAFGKATAPAAPQPPAATQAAAPAQRVPATTGGDPPAKILRPGSLLDIRV